MLVRTALQIRQVSPRGCSNVRFKKDIDSCGFACGLAERVDGFSEVAEAAPVRGGNSPIGSSGVQQRKVKQRKQRNSKHICGARKLDKCHSD